MKPLRYDDEGQNVGNENVGVELDCVRHHAGVYRRWDWIATGRESPECRRGIIVERLNASDRPLSHESFQLPLNVSRF